MNNTRKVFGDSDEMIEKGNIDLHKRPVVKNKDGSYSTVASMSFQDEDGSEVLIPTVSDDGKIMTPKEAVLQYYKTGKHLGKFQSSDSANKYAQKLHEEQEKYYKKKGEQEYGNVQ